MYCTTFPVSVLPSEKLMSPRMCSSLIEANTRTTMPTVCSPSVSQMALSIAPPSAHSAPPYPEPNPEPESASSLSGPPPAPGTALPPGPVLQFPCVHSSSMSVHGPGASGHPPTARLLPKSSLRKVRLGRGWESDKREVPSGFWEVKSHWGSPPDIQGSQRI